VSQHHDRIKNDRRWKTARAECLERDGYACIVCGATEELEADHILPLAEYPELAFDVENLRTLCRPCHINRDETTASTLERAAWINPRYLTELRDVIPVL
jgi:5-methylcytosine-specific restriction endonuclease McrA